MITLKIYAVRTKEKLSGEYIYSQPMIFKDNADAQYYILEAVKGVPYQELFLEQIADYDPKNGDIFPINKEDREVIDLLLKDNDKIEEQNDDESKEDE